MKYEACVITNTEERNGGVTKARCNGAKKKRNSAKTSEACRSSHSPDLNSNNPTDKKREGRQQRRREEQRTSELKEEREMNKRNMAFGFLPQTRTGQNITYD
ncbi:hypothetical protein WMY93_005693 [Mugilogobius chulae]|uniref:Uncharacterized protein n=1 Tax=Mugilogobius chulae TaxID=88201 RepID=A0AAW0PX25_9GOBI